MVKKEKENNEDLMGDKLLFEDDSEDLDENKKKSDDSDSEPKRKTEMKKSNKKQNRSHNNRSRVFEQHDSGISINYKNLSGFFFERLIYIIIIIVLLVLLLKGGSCEFRNPINFNFTGSDDIDSNDSMINMTAEGNDDNITVTSNETVSPSDAGTVFFAIKDGKCVEVAVDYDGTSYSSALRCVEALGDGAGTGSSGSGDCDGEVEVKIDDINVNSDTEKRIDSVDVEIVNNNDEDFSKFYIRLYYIDPDDSVHVNMLKSSDNDGKYAITTRLFQKCGGSDTLNLDNEMVTHFVPTRDEAITFKVELYEYDDKDEKIDSALKVLPRD